jgi:uncharacterized protein (TIGR02145 family)
MPDGKWWLAQNVKLASYNGSTIGAAISGCTKDECGRSYTYAQAYASYGGSSGSTGNVQGICPPGWLLPTHDDWTYFVWQISSTSSVVTQQLRPLNSTCSPIEDYYGWASIVGLRNGNSLVPPHAGWYANSGSLVERHWGLGLDGYGCGTFIVGKYDGNYVYDCNIRCFRQL